MESDTNHNNELDQDVNKIPVTEELPSDEQIDEMIDGMMHHFATKQERIDFFEARNNRDNK